MKKVCLFLIIQVAGSVSGLASDQGFFRISSPSSAVISGFDAVAGSLTCSNAVAGAIYQIQSTHDLAETNGWVDFVQLISDFPAAVTEVIIDLDSPENMALIPGGVFQMGDSLFEGGWDERPVHTVYVSPFYIGKYEVTNDEMVQVFQWAYDHGKLLASTSGIMNVEGDQQELLDLDDEHCRITWDGGAFGIKSEKGVGYPCVEVSWYGAAAYCNYRSEMEGRMPCYDLAAWSCNWDADGYRLPTEAEWEKAARGGLNGKRLAWGDSVAHSDANYYSYSGHVSYGFPYDISLTGGYHPDYNDGVLPYTSPVGTFAPNGYGLHDMIGNVWEWCWDWYDGAYYGIAPSADPRGPQAGLHRVAHGGSWGTQIWYCRLACRNGSYPSDTSFSEGFRICLSIPMQTG